MWLRSSSSLWSLRGFSTDVYDVTYHSLRNFICTFMILHQAQWWMLPWHRSSLTNWKFKRQCRKVRLVFAGWGYTTAGHASCSSISHHLNSSWVSHKVTACLSEVLSAWCGHRLAKIITQCLKITWKALIHKSQYEWWCTWQPLLRCSQRRITLTVVVCVHVTVFFSFFVTQWKPLRLQVVSVKQKQLLQWGDISGPWGKPVSKASAVSFTRKHTTESKHKSPQWHKWRDFQPCFVVKVETFICCVLYTEWEIWKAWLLRGGGRWDGKTRSRCREEKGETS